jgi:hypothetical protein
VAAWRTRAARPAAYAMHTPWSGQHVFAEELATERTRGNTELAHELLTGRVIAAWPSFALTAPRELLTVQVRGGAPDDGSQAPREVEGGQGPAAA